MGLSSSERTIMSELALSLFSSLYSVCTLCVEEEREVKYINCVHGVCEGPGDKCVDVLT